MQINDSIVVSIQDAWPVPLFTCRKTTLNGGAQTSVLSFLNYRDLSRCSRLNKNWRYVTIQKIEFLFKNNVPFEDLRLRFSIENYKCPETMEFTWQYDKEKIHKRIDRLSRNDENLTSVLSWFNLFQKRGTLPKNICQFEIKFSEEMRYQVQTQIEKHRKLLEKIDRTPSLQIAGTVNNIAAGIFANMSRSFAAAGAGSY